MGRVFKNLIPYWKSVVLIIALLFIQAYCDLALPAYTSDIIDVGIQNNGVDCSLPEALTAQEYDRAQILMTEEEKKIWQSCYEEKEDQSGYARILKTEKEREEAEEKLDTALFLNAEFYRMEEASFRSMISKAAEAGGEQSSSAMKLFDQMSLETLEKMSGTSLDIRETETEDENGETVLSKTFDARPLFEKILSTQDNAEELLSTVRDQIHTVTDTMGSSLLKSVKTAYAVSCDQAAGLDLDAIQRNYLVISGLRMIGMTFLMAAAAILVGFLASRVGAGVGKNMRQAVFGRVVSFSGSEMERFSTASLITRCTNDVQQVQMMTVLMIRMVAYAPILGVGGVIKVVQTGAGMGWVIVLTLLVILGLVGILLVVAMPKFKAMQMLVDRLNLVSREILTGLSVIRAFGREQKEEERFDAANRELTNTMLFTNHVMNFMMPGMTFIMYGLSVLIVWTAAHRIDLGVMQVGDMTAFLTYAMQIVMSFLMLTALSIMLPRAAVAANRIDEVMKTEPSIADPEKVLPARTEGTLAFEHVGFCYPGAKEEALSDISFTACPGKVTAVIGSTGCGKSTLVNLIPRLYDVTSGRILLAGTDIRKLSLKDLRGRIGFVPQKAVLFSGTIRSNLEFGKEDAAAEQIAEALKIAQAEDFVREKEDGIDSVIAQGGSNVSGGQKQRLCIARAVVRDPFVYVFDDSFSALDLKTDAALRKALAQKTGDAAVIIVAQRISTILHADQILVLDEGRQVGLGTHEELLRSCSVYKQIARSQLSAEELRGQLKKAGIDADQWMEAADHE